MLTRVACIWFPALILCLLGAYRLGVPATEGAHSRLADLPYELLGLPGEDLSLDEAIIQDLDPDDIVIRRYRRPDGVPVWVVLIYFVNTRLGGHDPQLCYRSQGYRVEKLPEMRLQVGGKEISADCFMASNRQRAERVATFWHAPGGSPTSDVRHYRNLLFLQGVRENRLYGIFVRVSTLETSTEGEAQAWNERFVAEVARRLPSLLHEQRRNRTDASD